MDKQLLKKTALGGITNNPIFVLVLGMCPILATSSTIDGAFWLGIATAAILVLTSLIISLLRKIIPVRIRIPCYIIVLATLVTISDMLLQKYLPEEIYAMIGSAVSLIVVNCIIMARAESFASKNKPVYAVVDGVSMGVGLIAAIMLLAGFRVLLNDVLGIEIFSTTAGGFLALALLMAMFNYVVFLINSYRKKKQKSVKEAA